jgi:hypothetical protein
MRLLAPTYTGSRPETPRNVKPAVPYGRPFLTSYLNAEPTAARKELYRGLASAGVPLPTAAEDSPEARFFSEPKATAALRQIVSNASLFKDREQATKEADRGIDGAGKPCK